MKRSIQIVFVVVFLLIIAIVPVAQTLYELSTNQHHRIQMLDLFTDIFVTPREKATTDFVQIDTLVRTVDLIAQNGFVPADSLTNGNADALLTQLEDATIFVNVLKHSVINYNRHLCGAHNPFAAIDTVKPYYKSLSLVA